MCSLHPRINKKFSEILEDVRNRIGKEVSDGDIFILKSTKRKASDEMRALKECAVAESLDKVFNSPTPSPKNLSQVQAHVDDLLKQMRR
jgi:hypothetical protein